MDVNGKLALVTGGSDGIGRELALLLQAAGAEVIVTGRSAQRLAAMEQAGFEIITAELSDASGIDAVVAAIGTRPLALLVNNAGGGTDYDPDRPESLGDAARCIRLNLDAPIALITYLLPNLRSQKTAMIVNVSSGLAIAPRGGGSIYCATKAGLRSFTQSLRPALKDSGIKVVEALPPVVDTQLTAGRDTKKMSAPDCAAEIYRGIQTDKAEINVGMVKILQLVHSISPGLARRIMLRF